MSTGAVFGHRRPARPSSYPQGLVEPKDKEVYIENEIKKNPTNQPNNKTREELENHLP